MSKFRRKTLFTLAGLTATAWAASAQTPEVPMPFTGEVVRMQPPKPPEKLPKKDEKKEEPKALPVVPPVTLPASAAPLPDRPLQSSGSQVQVSSLPPVYGDLLGPRYNPYLVATVPGGQMQAVRPNQVALFPLGTTFSQNVPTQIVRVQTGTEIIPPPNGDGPPIVVPVFTDFLQVTGPAAMAASGAIPVNVARGAFKIAENESPRPTDRFYATYNFFYNVNASLNVPEMPRTNVNRETIGLEKTFLDGNASIGLRLPFIQISGPSNIDRDGVGDLSVIFKYAFINEWNANPDGTLTGGNVLSAGMVVTAPTGGLATYSALQPEIHSTLLQPWVGGILVRGNAYLQGFSSYVVPTDSSDTQFLFNSFQLGYLLWQAPTSGRILTSVTPVLETHITTPLNNRDLYRLPIGTVDIVSFTGGATLGLGRSSFLNLGANIPVTGPRPYDVEAQVQFNFYY